MKLIDFLSFAPFEQLRSEMGAPLVESIGGLSSSTGIEETLEVILKTKGLDIESLDVLTFHDDGTLVYKDTRVILYIRDWSFSSRYNNPAMPRFHVSNCRTLQDMTQRGRGARYVIATREDGIFIVNKTSDGIVEKGINAKLDICKNCLSTLNWSGYTSGGNKSEIFNHFTISDFFKKYPKSLLSEGNRQKDNVAPLNHYVEDWNVLSKSLRESKSWKCESCSADMRNQKDQLHVHHINGIKNDNNLTNLKVLCKTCHAKEPRHEHLL